MEPATLNPAPQGHNNPPVDPFDAHSANLADWIEQARQWLDGAPIDNVKQAEAVDTLQDALRKGVKAADDARKAEKKPHDDAGKAVQAKWLPIIEPAERAKTTCDAALTKWRNKLAAEQAAEAKRIRDEADRIAREAAEAARQVDRANLEQVEKTEAALQTAQTMTKQADRAERDQGKRLGLRDNWQITGFAETTDADGMPIDGRGLLLRHYLKTRPEELVEACLQLARRDVLNGTRAIPGLSIENLRKAA